jgi:ADP-heptose:LPS heptosyltransferase
MIRQRRQQCLEKSRAAFALLGPQPLMTPKLTTIPKPPEDAENLSRKSPYSYLCFAPFATRSRDRRIFHCQPAKSFTFIFA